MISSQARPVHNPVLRVQGYYTDFVYLIGRGQHVLKPIQLAVIFKESSTVSDTKDKQLAEVIPISKAKRRRRRPRPGQTPCEPWDGHERRDVEKQRQAIKRDVEKIRDDNAQVVASLIEVISKINKS